MAVVQCLSTICKLLDSITSTTKLNDKIGKINGQILLKVLIEKYGKP